MYLTLKILAGKHVGKELRIAKTQFIIGRGDDCHLRAISGEVSRQHCEISVRDGMIFIRDLGSTNGSFVNGKRITDSKQLRTGDVLIIGPLMFEVRLPTMAATSEVAERSEWNIDEDDDGINLVTDEFENDKGDKSGRTQIRGSAQLEFFNARTDLGGTDPKAPGDLTRSTHDTSRGGQNETLRDRPPIVKPIAASPLTKEIVRVIEDHLQKLPALTWADARSALRQALLLIEQKEAGQQSS